MEDGGDNGGVKIIRLVVLEDCCSVLKEASRGGPKHLEQLGSCLPAARRAGLLPQDHVTSTKRRVPGSYILVPVEVRKDAPWWPKQMSALPSFSPSGRRGCGGAWRWRSGNPEVIPRTRVGVTLRPRCAGRRGRDVPRRDYRSRGCESRVQMCADVLGPGSQADVTGSRHLQKRLDASR